LLAAHEPELVGEFADDAADRLRDALAERLPDHEWTTERYLGRTPVDVAGAGTPELFVELEWRRADPANNTVKLFRHLADDAEGPVHVVQLFSGYYELRSGGVSSKRANAEFVGDRVATTLEAVDYTPLTLDIDPPKRGGERPDGWTAAVTAAADRIERLACADG
jgi:hypothetical protein